MEQQLLVIFQIPDEEQSYYQNKFGEDVHIVTLSDNPPGCNKARIGQK